MFDIGFLEIVIIASIALVVLGPERLPRAARTAGMWVGRARRMVADVKSDIDREIRESELADMRKLGEEVNSIKDDVSKATESIKEDNTMAGVVDSINESAKTLREDATEKTGAG
ncbi:MAG: Sec-independent protein translocase protein TatB [Arenicellales bacterium]